MQSGQTEQALVFAGIEYVEDPQTAELRVTPIFELREPQETRSADHENAIESESA